MKRKTSNLMLAASLASFSGIALAAPPNWDNIRFVHAEESVGSTAACLVSVGNPGPGIAACLCAMGNPSACDAEGGFSFAIHPQFEASWAAAMEVNETILSATVSDGWDGNDGGADEPLNVKLDARGSCGLTQGSLELAVDFDPKDAKRRLKGLVGAQAMYSAVYMFPVRAPGIASPYAWESVPDTDPVRLCSLGQAQVLAAGEFRKGHGKDHKGDQRRWKSGDFAVNLSLLETGVSGAAQWVGKNYGEAADNIDRVNTFGVQYVVVAGVADALLKVGGKQVAALGVVANARVTDRSLFIVRSSDSPNFFNTVDQD